MKKQMKHFLGALLLLVFGSREISAQNILVGNNELMYVKNNGDTCHQAFTVDSEEAEKRYEKGLKLLSKNKLDKAFSEFSTAINLNSDEDGAFASRSAIHKLRGDFQSALDDINRAVVLSPCNKYRYLDRAEVFMRMNNWLEAESDFKEYLTWDEKNPEIYRKLGVVHLKLKEEKEACKYLSTSVEKGDIPAKDLWEENCVN